MKSRQKGHKDRKPGPPIPAKLAGKRGDRHQQRRPSWHAPRRGQA